MSKTRRISLGLMQYSKKRNKYVSVRYSKVGGTRLIDVPLSMTKEELIKEGKVLFFQNGVCPLGAESDMIFELVNFKGEVINTLKERNGGALPFTVQRYFESYKLSKVQLYIACRPLVDDDSDDGELMTSPFSASDREDLVDKGKQSTFLCSVHFYFHSCLFSVQRFSPSCLFSIHSFFHCCLHSTRQGFVLLVYFPT